MTPTTTSTLERPARAASPAGAHPLQRSRRASGRRPRWAAPGLAVLLLGTAVLFLWGLGASGYGNEYYAAAVQAGTQSWKAMFFGSLDAGNAITVDKPAFFLWPMEISARIFGLNGWSLLVPQALEGVAAVALLAAAVRRVAGHAAGLAAGAAFALTPVAVLMFRFDNPDAMLTLLLTGAGYATVRALEPGGRARRWLALAGTLVGLGFITKMGQALLVVPGLGLAHLLASPRSLGKRVLDLGGAVVALVAGAGWYVAVVELWPASSRPYIGGSTTNSLLELAFGYNGLGRLFGGTGNGGGGGAGGGAGGSFSGATGITRLFDSQMAGEASWLLPAALVSLVAGLWLTRRAPRTDLRRAALVAFGGWLLVTGLVFSFMQGTIHPYYTIALAPAIAASVAVTSRLVWEQRASLAARLVAALMIEVSVLWGAHLLGTASTFVPWLAPVLVVAGSLAAVAVVVAGSVPRLRRGVAITLVAGLLAGLGGSTAWAAATAGRPHTGSMVSSGPAEAGRSGPGDGTNGTGGGTRSGSLGGQPPSGAAPSGTAASGTTSGTGQAPAATGDGASGDSALTALLQATTTRWAAAAGGSMSAAPLQLASGKAVMAIGGFNGSDASPTLEQFKALVAQGQIRYYVASGQGAGGGPGGGSSSGSAIAGWVASTFTSSTVGGSTVYDLTTAK